MSQSEFDVLLSELEDIRRRVDGIYNIMTKSENDIRKRVDACYKSIWKVYQLLEEMKK